MPFQRLPETVQTLYAELLDQAIQAEAALLKALHGTFVSKAIKGGTLLVSPAHGGGPPAPALPGEGVAHPARLDKEVQEVRGRRRPAVQFMRHAGGRWSGHGERPDREGAVSSRRVGDLSDWGSPRRDFLTPLFGPGSTKPVFLPALIPTGSCTTSSRIPRRR